MPPKSMKIVKRAEFAEFIKAHKLTRNDVAGSTIGDPGREGWQQLVQYVDSSGVVQAQSIFSKYGRAAWARYELRK